MTNHRCCQDFNDARRKSHAMANAAAGSGLPTSEPGMPSPAGTGLDHRSYLVRGADWLPIGYALGLVVMGRDKRFRRLGDMAAGTMVVAELRHAVSDPLYIHPAPTAREVSSLPQRLPLSGDELEALELFLRRAPKLHPARTEELAEIVAPVFAKRLGLRFRGDARRFLEVLYYRSRERTAQ